MTLDQLKVLCAVIETGSFSAAAEKLNRVQSAVSIAIKKLEESLDIKIFDRDAYRPRLTEAGVEVHRQALTILKQTDFLNYTAEQLAIGEESEISIAIDGICPLDLITKNLKGFKEDNPHLRIQLYIEYLGGMERLSQGTIDIAFTQVLEWPTWIDAIPLVEIPYLPVVAADHPLAMTDNAINKEIDKFTQIVVSSSQKTPLSVNVMEEATIWHVGDFSSKRQLIVEGFGWGYMPQHMIDTDLKENKLVALNLGQGNKNSKIKSRHSENIVTTHQLYIVRRNDRPIGPLASRFWNLFEEGIS
ncbi:MAG: LysR family transcriptional regulator [marine bacterium B5-7]|nr:MAG: LysR family transcriptional regulator [marine bacterium B5-7]